MVFTEESPIGEIEIRHNSTGESAVFVKLKTGTPVLIFETLYDALSVALDIKHSTYGYLKPPHMEVTEEKRLEIYDSEHYSFSDIVANCFNPKFEKAFIRMTKEKEVVMKK